jgi:hypothetical protein
MNMRFDQACPSSPRFGTAMCLFGGSVGFFPADQTQILAPKSTIQVSFEIQAWRMRQLSTSQKSKNCLDDIHVIHSPHRQICILDRNDISSLSLSAKKHAEKIAFFSSPSHSLESIHPIPICVFSAPQSYSPGVYAPRSVAVLTLTFTIIFAGNIPLVLQKCITQYSAVSKSVLFLNDSHAIFGSSICGIILLFFS